MTPTIASIARLGVALALQTALCPVAPAAGATPVPAPPAAAGARHTEIVSSDPVRFEQNLGQVAGDARFLARFGGATATLAPAAAVFQLVEAASLPPTPEGERLEPRQLDDHAELRRAEVTMRFVGGDPAAEVAGERELEGRSHYFLGSDPESWITDVPSYARVRYHELYPGVDAVFYDAGGGRLEYDLVVAAGADPTAVAIAFEGSDGAAVDEAGSLVVETPAGALRFGAPDVYQHTTDGRRPVAARYAPLGGATFGFDLGAYDTSLPVVIDPVVAVMPELGVYRICFASDQSGAMYGYEDPPGENAFVKRTAAGAVVYRAFVAGIGIGTLAIAIGADGSLYATGYSEGGLPTSFNAVQPTFAGGDKDAFALKLSPSGASLVYATYLGGSANDFGQGISVDASNTAWVVGGTHSVNFPVLAPNQAAHAGGRDAFVARLDGPGSALLFSTFLGGSGDESAATVACNDAGDAWVAGPTSSANFPLRVPIDASLGGLLDTFVTRFIAGGGSMRYSTLLGGSQGEVCAAIAVDATGNAYVTGTTYSSDFPTRNPVQGFKGAPDVYVTKIDPTGSSLVYSTFLGGSDYDRGGSIVVNAAGEAYVGGASNSPDFPIVNPVSGSAPPAAGSLPQEFVAKLKAAGSVLLYATMLPADGHTLAQSIPAVVAPGPTGSVYLSSTEADYNANTFYVSTRRIVDVGADLTASLTATPTPAKRSATLTYRATIANTGSDTASAVVRLTTPGRTAFISASTSQGTVTSAPSAGLYGTVSVSTGPIPVGGQVVVTVVVRVAPSAPSSLTATTEATGSLFDPNVANSRAAVTTPVTN